MYEITMNQCEAVSGGLIKEAIIITAAFGGAYVSSSIASWASPAATVVSTLAGVGIGGFAGTFCIPIPLAGTLIGGGLGALTGYLLGAPFAVAGAFALGGLGGGFAAFAALA